MVNKGFMTQDSSSGKYKFRPLSEIMDPELREDEIPKNILHIF